MNWQEISIWMKLGIILIYIEIMIEKCSKLLKNSNKNSKFVKIIDYVNIFIIIILLLVIMIDASTLWDKAELGFKIGTIMIIISVSGMTLLTLLIQRKKEIVKGT